MTFGAARLLLALRQLEAGLLLPQHFDQRGLEVVLELRRVEVARLGFEDVLGELQHLAGIFMSEMPEK